MNFLHLFLHSTGTTVYIPALILTGIFVGFLTGMFGAGGGFILTPVLKIIFGLPYPVVIGSGLMLILMNSLISTVKHWKNGNVNIGLGFIIATGAMFGTELGVRLLSVLDKKQEVSQISNGIPILDTTINIIFLLILSFVSVSIFIETSSKNKDVDTTLFKMISKLKLKPMILIDSSNSRYLSLWIPVLLSVCVGVLTGLLGIGGGFINFPLLVYVIGVPTLMAVGTSSFQIIFASAWGTIRHASAGHVDLVLVAVLFLGSVVGVQIGVKASHYFSGKKIRRLFAFVILLGILLVLWDLITTLVI